jgi:hypothetical protein
MSHRFAFAALLAVAFGAPVRADYLISSQFDSPTGPVNNFAYPSSWATAPLLFRSESAKTLPGNADVKIAEISSDVYDAASPYLQGTQFHALAFTLLANLTDAASGKAGTLAFPATISGNVNGGSLAVDSQEFIGSATRSVILGDNAYTVTITREPINYQTNEKSIHDDFTAHVEVTAAPPVATAPEPSTLMLAGAGASLLLACRRRWRGRQQRAVSG